MHNIQQALGRLYHSLEGLESAAETQEQELLRLQQQELFPGNNGHDGNHAAPASGPAVNPALLAEKLDSAISKIEDVLKEG